MIIAFVPIVLSLNPGADACVSIESGTVTVEPFSALRANGRCVTSRKFKRRDYRPKKAGSTAFAFCCAGFKTKENIMKNSKKNTVKIGTFSSDKRGVMQGKIYGLGLGVTLVILEPQT